MVSARSNNGAASASSSRRTAPSKSKANGVKASSSTPRNDDFVLTIDSDAELSDADSDVEPADVGGKSNAAATKRQQGGAGKGEDIAGLNPDFEFDPAGDVGAFGKALADGIDWNREKDEVKGSKSVSGRSCICSGVVSSLMQKGCTY